jgi:hypothetical protein
LLKLSDPHLEAGLFMQKYLLQFPNPDLLARNKVVLGNRVIFFGNRETAELVDGSSLEKSEVFRLNFKPTHTITFQEV